MQGIWTSTFGPLRLTSKGDRVNGIYRDLGVIEARRSGNRIEGTFSNTGQVGRFLWLLSADEDEFFGRWGWGASGTLNEPDIDDVVEPDEWVGAKNGADLSTDTARGRPWQGEWNSDFGKLHLVQNGNRLYGLYRDLGIIDGTISGPTAVGRFTNGGNEGWFRFTLSSNGDAFSGSYGWRENEEKGDWDAKLDSRPISAVNDRYEIEQIDVPYAPGETKLLVRLKRIGNPTARPEVIVQAAETARDLDVDPIEVSAYRIRQVGAHTDVEIQLPVAPPGKSQPGTLRMARPFHGKIEVQLEGRITDVKDMRFDMPDPIVVFNIGDSYGSGVGIGSYDLHSGAKRSSRSGQHRAMTELAGKAPTLVGNFAWSGNKLVPDIMTEDGHAGRQIREVLEQLRQWKRTGALREERVDYLIVTAGGNDMHRKGLGGLVARLMISVLDPNKAVFFRKLRQELGDAKTNFAARLNAFDRLLGGTQAFAEARVIYSTYPDLTRNEDGEFDRPPRNALPQTNRLVTTLSKNDMSFAYNKVIDPLNDLIREWRNKNPQRYEVNDVETISRRHGYPSNDSWFVRARLSEGGITQDNLLIADAFHPSAFGHEKIYYETLRGRLQAPRKKADFPGGSGDMVTHRRLS